MLIVMCGRYVSKLGGQDRRWLRVSSILLDNDDNSAVINRSYYDVAKKSGLLVPDNIDIIDDYRGKYCNYLVMNFKIVLSAYKFKAIHYCGNSLEMTPSAIILFLLRKKISFSFNGVSTSYLASSGQKKSVFLLKVMSVISAKIEVLNQLIYEERFFPKKKLFLSNAMYSGEIRAQKTLKKHGKIIFAAHLYPLKGLELLSKIINSAPGSGYKFYIYGEPPSGFSDIRIEECIRSISTNDNVFLLNHCDDMSEVYCDATVVLSLQTISNYPSQVVLEGLASGASVVIVNTGDSKRFGDGPGLFYFDANASLIEIWKLIEKANYYSINNSICIANSVQGSYSPACYVDNFLNNVGCDE